MYHPSLRLAAAAACLAAGCGAQRNWSYDPPGGSGGGSSGSVVSPPHMVGMCNQLGAVGQWENITPAGVMLSPPYTGVLMAVADPVRTGTVYALTYQSGVYKSTDCGATWAKTNTGQNGSQLDSGRIWSAVIDPIAPDTLYALVGYGAEGLWKTTNDGTDWNQVLPYTTMTGVPGFLARVAIDPTNHLHLILNFHDNCSGSYTPVCFAETKDGGSTWNIVNFPTSLKNAWGEGTGVIIVNAKTWLYANWELYLTTDAGSTWTQVTPGVSIDPALFHAAPPGDAGAGADFISSAEGIFTSTDDMTWTQIPNSGGHWQQVIGDGTSLYAIEGFYPPSGNPFIMSATYAAPMTWTMPATPGLPSPLQAGANDADYDADHHVLYAALQGEGLWRMKTK